jgi:hypothetical protein
MGATPRDVAPMALVSNPNVLRPKDVGGIAGIIMARLHFVKRYFGLDQPCLSRQCVDEFQSTQVPKFVAS